MSEELGCDVCRTQVYSVGEPRFVVATTPTDLLYRCSVCGTWWVGDSRAAWPVSPQTARERFPNEVTS